MSIENEQCNNKIKLFKVFGINCLNTEMQLYRVPYKHLL